MKLKKIITMFLSCALMMATFAGCASETGTSGSASDKTTQSSRAEGTSNTVTSDSSDTTSDAGTSKPGSEGRKALVVYYSATGNTKAVANTIAKALNADTFELVPKNPYTNEDLNWSNSNSRVSKEHDNPGSRNVELTVTTAPNWKSYDTVFIGYPIWWGIAAWPLDGFVKANDFTGKMVIPFCTSASSGLGESGKLLSKMAGTGNWLAGERFRSGASDEDVSTWAKSVTQ